ncbi:MAG TPA: NAD-dependent deacylase [Herpetosiphonaceae bacterium]|nr:NAD-dependent deacylase [Herpetosiphonaceae bacterium]
MVHDIPDDLLEALRTSERVVVLTGAGVSAESGVPTFREAQTGLWQQYDPRELATPQAFARNPRLVWEWYQWRRQLIDQAKPNAAHYALVDLEQHIPNFLLITQNIDGFHWAAGSRDMVELHGNIARTKCFDEGVMVDTWDDTGEVPPRCYHCGGYLRPDVVWFGEGIPEHALHPALDACATAQVFMSVGTSAVVAPAASFHLIAKRRGAKVVEINPEQTAVSMMADWSIRGKAGEILPELVRRLGIPTIALEGAGFS